VQRYADFPETPNFSRFFFEKKRKKHGKDGKRHAKNTQRTNSPIIFYAHTRTGTREYGATRKKRRLGDTGEDGEGPKDFLHGKDNPAAIHPAFGNTWRPNPIQAGIVQALATLL